MKKIIISITLGIVIITAALSSLANMNVINLLVSGTDYGDGSSEMFSSKEPKDGEEQKYYLNGTTDNATQEALQSGLLGGSGGDLNLLWLLQNAKSPKKSSYAYQLLEVYANMGEGKYNSNSTHISPEAMAGSHYNESKLASFVVPVTSGYGKAVTSGLSKTVTLENSTKKDAVGASGSAVYVDATRDGYPDGPFQIESGKQSDSNASKLRGDKKYDLYSFVDAANVTDTKYDAIASKIKDAGEEVDARAIAALFGMYHNRGAAGVGWMLHGLPYTNTSAGNNSYLKHSTLESMSAKELKSSLQFPEQFMKWYDKANIPLESSAVSTQSSRGLAALLILSNGGFFDMPVGSAMKGSIEAVSTSTIKKMFPKQTNKTIVSYINKNLVKKPWDVLGVSKEKYGKIYNASSISTYESIYRSDQGMNTSFYIDKSVKSKNYSSGNQVVVRAIEGIAAGYMIDVGVGGTYVLLNIALEAGIKSLKNGAVIDPSNPSLVYKTTTTNDGGKGDVYNPAEEATGNFGKFLEGLGLAGKLSVTQQAQIGAMYKVAGGGYSQVKRGTKDANGLYYMDCSSMASIGLNLGIGPKMKSTFTDTLAINNGLWLKGVGKTDKVNGKTYDARVVQLDKSGKPMAKSNSRDTSQLMLDKSWLSKLQTGDMVNGRGPNGGHIFTILGHNKSGKTMVLTQDISKVNAPFSKYADGSTFTFQAASYANGVSAGGNGSDFSGKMGLMPLWADSSNSATYHAMRPVYNLK